MSFFIADALAEAAPAAQEPGAAGLILPMAVLAVFFLLFVLPQDRRQRSTRSCCSRSSRG